jgi:hypothetical protein
MWCDRYLYEEDNERADKLSAVIEVLENSATPSSPQTKSPSKELSGTLKNLKRMENVFKGECAGSSDDQGFTKIKFKDFISVMTKACYKTLSEAISVQFTLSEPVSITTYLIIFPRYISYQFS